MIVLDCELPSIQQVKVHKREVIPLKTKLLMLILVATAMSIPAFADTIIFTETFNLENGGVGTNNYTGYYVVNKVLIIYNDEIPNEPKLFRLME